MASAKVESTVRRVTSDAEYRYLAGELSDAGFKKTLDQIALWERQAVCTPCKGRTVLASARYA